MENIFGYRANRFLRKPITIKEETPKTKIEPIIIPKEEKIKKFVTITKCAYCDCVDSYVKGICIHCGGNQQIKVKGEISMAMKFIKTVNSPVDTADFAEELEANDIEFEYGDTGVYVNEEDFDEAENILMEMEE